MLCVLVAEKVPDHFLGVPGVIEQDTEPPAAPGRQHLAAPLFWHLSINPCLHYNYYKTAEFSLGESESMPS